MAEKILSKEEYSNISKEMIKEIKFFNPSFVGSDKDALKWIVNNQLSPSVLGRSAFCERFLKNAYKLGCKQYLIFASGYDTFGYRNNLNGLKVFEIDRETKVVYAARFIKEKINKEFYLEFLKKLEAKYPMVKVDKPDLYQGNMGYEGEQHTYRFGDYYLVYTYYAPQQIIEVDYFYSPQRINDL